MSREVLLSVKLAQLLKAEEGGKRVLVALKRAEGLTKDVKRQIATTTREGLSELRELKAQELARLRGIKDRATQFAAGLNAGRFDSSSLIAPLRAVNQVREKAGAALNLVTGGVGSLGSLASLGGPLAAAIAAVALPVVQQVAKAFEESMEAKLELAKLELQDELEGIAYDLDYERRLREDPAFARREAQRGYDLTVKQLGGEARAAERPGGGDFLGGF